MISEMFKNLIYDIQFSSFNPSTNTFIIMYINVFSFRYQQGQKVNENEKKREDISDSSHMEDALRKNASKAVGLSAKFGWVSLIMMLTTNELDPMKW